MTLGQNGVLRYGQFSDFSEIFGDRMANLSLIDLKLGFYIEVNVNDGQNIFEVHISKHLAKMARCHFWARITRHNSVIFYPIFTFFCLNARFLKTDRMVTITKLYFL